jgi:hypothetical protein
LLAPGTSLVAGGTAMDWETIGFWDGAADDFHGPERSLLELARYAEGFREGAKYQRKRSSTALAVKSDSPHPGKGGRHERRARPR